MLPSYQDWILRPRFTLFKCICFLCFLIYVVVGKAFSSQNFSETKNSEMKKKKNLAKLHQPVSNHSSKAYRTYIIMALSSLFGGASSTPVTSTKVDSSAQIKEQLKAQISQELAIANATELVNKITENCFEQCLKAPYSNSDEPCVDRCLEKYMRSWNTISKTYIARIQQASR